MFVVTMCQCQCQEQQVKVSVCHVPCQGHRQYEYFDPMINNVTYQWPGKPIIWPNASIVFILKVILDKGHKISEH